MPRLAAHCAELELTEQMTVTYEVGGSLGGGHLDIDFYVTEPGGSTIYSIHRKPQGSFDMEAAGSGRYTYCFSNEMSTYARKILRCVLLWEISLAQGQMGK